MANSILRYPVEITQPLAEVENQLLTVMLILCTSQTNPTLEGSFQMGEDPSVASLMNMNRILT